MREKYFVDSKTGVFLGSFLGGAEPPDGAVEINLPPLTGSDIWDFIDSQWVPYDPPYDVKRKKEYEEKLGDQGDQNDAIYKCVIAIVDILKTLGVSNSQLNDAGLLSNKNAEPGTPAHWLGTIEDIKTRNPKPNK